MNARRYVDIHANVQVLELRIHQRIDKTTARSSAGPGAGDLILARVNTPQDLSRALKSASDQLARGVPIWFIYPKGKAHALTENEVRNTALATGIVDTKVAAISKTLTALRFVKRRTPKLP